MVEGLAVARQWPDERAPWVLARPVAHGHDAAGALVEARHEHLGGAELELRFLRNGDGGEERVGALGADRVEDGAECHGVGCFGSAWVERLPVVCKCGAGACASLPGG